VADGDLRRAMKMEDGVFELVAKDIMTKSPKWISPDEIAAAALAIMEKHSITGLLVCDDEKGEHLAGMIHFHDLLKAGVV
jgi:arabinose-5-phosphate isomerase